VDSSAESPKPEAAAPEATEAEAAEEESAAEAEAEAASSEAAEAQAAEAEAAKAEASEEETAEEEARTAEAPTAEAAEEDSVEEEARAPEAAEEETTAAEAAWTKARTKERAGAEAPEEETAEESEDERPESKAPEKEGAAPEAIATEMAEESEEETPETKAPEKEGAAVEAAETSEEETTESKAPEKQGTAAEAAEESEDEAVESKTPAKEAAAAQAAQKEAVEKEAAENGAAEEEVSGTVRATEKDAATAEAEAEGGAAEPASPTAGTFADDFEDFAAEADGAVQNSPLLQRNAAAESPGASKEEDGAEATALPDGGFASRSDLESEVRECPVGEIVEFSLVDQEPRIQVGGQETIPRLTPTVRPPSVSRGASVRSRRFAGLESSYSPRAFTARARDPPPRLPPPASLKKWIEAALAERSLKGATPEILEQVLVELQERRKELAIGRRFGEAARYHAAAEFVLAFHISQSKSELQQEGLARHAVQAKAVQEELRAYDSETSRLFSELKAVQAKKRQDLIEAQSTERREHSAQWESVRKERYYNRPSNRVMILRHQQTLLAAQCRFLEADSVTRIISDATQSEVFVRAKSRERDYEESLSQLKAKHAAEVEFFEEHSEVELAQLQQQRVALRRSLENKGKKIEAKGALIKDIERYWNSEQIARQTKTLGGKVFGALLSSSNVNISELAKNEIGFLALPRLSVESLPRSSPRRNRSD
jgi:hypothetical protein